MTTRTTGRSLCVALGQHRRKRRAVSCPAPLFHSKTGTFPSHPVFRAAPLRPSGLATVIDTRRTRHVWMTNRIYLFKSCKDRQYILLGYNDEPKTNQLTELKNRPKQNMYTFNGPTLGGGTLRNNIV